MGSSMMDTTFDDLGKKMGPGRVCCGGCASVCLGILIIVFGPATVSQLGQKKYGLTKNKMTGVVDLDKHYTPGWYMIGFWKEFIEFPSTLNTIEFSDEIPEEGVLQQGVLESRDQDGKRVWLDVTIQYKLKPESLGNMYKEMQNNYEDIFISGLRDALSKVGNRFPISRVWSDYSEASALLKTACEEALAERHAECWDIQLWRVQLEERYDQALIRTEVAKQAQRTEQARQLHEVVRAKTQAILAEYRANVTVINTTGQAMKYQIERAARAYAEALTVRVQADALREVRNIMKLNGSATPMSERQTVTYQQLNMLDSQEQAHFVYSGGLVDPVNVQAARAIVDSADRRLMEL